MLYEDAILYEIYGESLFSHFASIFPERAKEGFGNYEYFRMKFIQTWQYTVFGEGAIAIPFLKQLTLSNKK